MHRFYMTPETRQALIAESNRLIASRAGRHPHKSDGSADATDSEWPATDTGADVDASALESRFARLVSDLEATSANSSPY
jgi:hypothetical protein